MAPRDADKEKLDDILLGEFSRHRIQCSSGKWSFPELGREHFVHSLPQRFIRRFQWWLRWALLLTRCRTHEIEMPSNTLRTDVPMGAIATAGFLLGFALSGFFDGILLHQILQWHHLLSALTQKGSSDITFQILADGLFHLLMYLIAAAGLFQCWRVRSHLAHLLAERQLRSMALIGFGSWHIADGVLSHWILGIHRIRMESDIALFWDLLWFFVFGVAFVAAGWYVRKPDRQDGPATSHTGKPMACILASSVLLGALLAALPPAGSTTALVFLKPGTAPIELFRGMAATNARVLWSDASGRVWALNLPKPSAAPIFYQHGALLVSGSALAMGCLAWTTARPR